MQPTMTLARLREEIGDCKECPLHKTRTNLVFGAGNEKAKVMFVGEAPGYYEDQQGEPFVGAAGKLLDELLKSINFKRSDIYIANVLKCRPPKNRDPSPIEITSCKNKLLKQIEIIDPKIISTLGNFSTKLLLNLETGISKLRGKPYRSENRIIFPIYHPAAGLYTNSIKDILYGDFKRLELLINDDDIAEVNSTDKQNKTESNKIKNNRQLTLW